LARLVDQIAEYIKRLSYEDLSPQVIQRTKELILDSLGCAIGGASSPPARIAQAMAGGALSPNSSATVIGTGDRTSPDLATFANGIATRYLDYNDTYLGGGHPSDMLSPVIASVEAAGGNGQDAILGAIVGYEVYCGTRDSVELRRKEEGKRPYGNQTAFGPFGSTAVAAKAFGLSLEQTVHALNLAAVSHFPPSGGGGQLSHWKACHLAMSTRAGVFSAMLAAQGMTGPSAALEPGCGYFQTIGTPVEFEPYDFSKGEFRLLRSHVKAFPCGFHGMGPASAAMQLHSEVSARLDEVSEIRVHATRISAQLMASDPNRWQPETRETADHSIPFVVTMVLRDGALQIRHFDDELFLRPDVRALMAKIKIVTPDHFEGDFHEVPSVKVEVELQSGEVKRAEVLRPIGHPENPMKEADYERKFRSLAEPALPARQVNALLDRLHHLEDVRDLRELLLLTVPA
jgi:2-methylcitrate dehydratase